MNTHTDFQTAEPHVYTSQGNLPLASLGYSTRWEDGPDATTFIEEHRLGDEVVKRSVHVLSKQGLTGETVAGKVN